MVDSVELKKMYFGTTDGAAEAKRENFQELFYNQNNKYEEIMSSKEKFLIIGNKGTGKTYLANYILAKAPKKQTIQMVDANDFWIYKLSNINEEIYEEDLIYALCKWFLLDKLANLLLQKHMFRSKYISFSKVYKLKKFVEQYNNENIFKQIKVIESSNNEKNISEQGGVGAQNKKLNGNYKKGKDVKTSKGLTIESERKNFFELIDSFEKMLFNTVSRDDDVVFIVDDLDELEKVKNGKVIINLIKIAKEYNLIKKVKGNIKIILLLRSDILEKLQGNSANLSKIKTSCSVELYWLFNSMNEQYNHPLMSMILHKVKASCEEYSEYSNKKLFNILFPEKIDNKKPLDYLLDYGFGRPRDFVMYLNHAKNQFPQNTCFSAAILKGTRKLYSSDFYNELLNQTSFYGKPEYVKQCMNLLSSVKKVSFFYREIERCYMDNLERFNEINNLDDALFFLYEIGAIGNVWKTKRGDFHTCWAYKKDAMDEVDLTKKFTIHYGLRKKFSL